MTTSLNSSVSPSASGNAIPNGETTEVPLPQQQSGTAHPEL